MAEGWFKKLTSSLPSNWQLKIYMLLLAIILWVFVVTNQVFEIVLDVPLDIVDQKPSKVLVSEVPSTIAVRFSGLGRDLLILKYIQIPRVELDIHTINYFYDYPLQTAYVNIPPGLDAEPVAIVGQDTINIRLEDVLERLLPVAPQVTPLPALGYMVSGEVAATPDSVTVFGPQSVVRRLRRVLTDTVRFDGLERTLQEDVSLLPLDPKVRISPSTVRITVPIDKIAQREISRVAVEAKGVPLGREVLMEPSTVDVLLDGPAKRLAEMSVDSIRVTVDLYNWDPSQREYPLSVTTPDGIEPVGTEPDVIRVRLQQVDPSESSSTEDPW